MGAQVSGQLQALLVEAGDHVEEGQLLAQIDATLAQSQVDADRAQLKESQANYSQQQAQVELAQSVFDRAANLRAQDAISQADFESAQASLKVAKAQLVQLSAQIERQNSTLKSDLAELEYTNIYAPMSGTVTSLAAAEGQTLNANQSAPTILTISDLSVMTVEADVSEADVLRVKAGQDAYFTTLGDSDTRWETSVRQVLPEPEIVNDVVLYKALLDVDNPDDILKSSMTTQVFFIVSEARDAVIVPLAALQTPPASQRPGSGESVNASVVSDAPSLESDTPPTAQPEREGTRKIVLIYDTASGETRPRRVRIGIQTRSQAEVLSGLEVGETVVLGQQTPTAPPRSGDRQNQDRPNQDRRGPPMRF